MAFRADLAAGAKIRILPPTCTDNILGPGMLKFFERKGRIRKRL